MTQITREIEASPKSVYAEKWRQALFIHMLIGVGGIIAGTIEWLESTCEGTDNSDDNDQEQPKVESDPVSLLEQNPLGYVRTRSGRVADILGCDLYWIPRMSIGHDAYQNFSNVGDLMKSIGDRTLQRLQENDDLSRLAEALMKRAWRETTESVRQGIQEVVRRLYLISGAYSYGDHHSKSCNDLK